MHPQRLSLAAVAILAAAIAGTGCRTARMAVGHDLQARAEEWPVEGRQRTGFRERISFGPYRVTDIRRGWRNTRAWDTAEFRGAQVQRAQAQQRFEFRVDNGEGRMLQAHCSTHVRWQDVRGAFLGGTGTLQLDSETVFACTFDVAGEAPEPTWFLAMSQGTQDIVLNGALVSGERTVRVRGVRDLEGTSFPLLSPAGYTFHEGPRMIAAVEVINQGAVWFDPEMDPSLRDPIAAAAAALMLYREIN